MVRERVSFEVEDFEKGKRKLRTPASLSSSHASTPTREPFTSLDSTFKFTASSSGDLEHRSGWNKPLGDRQAVALLLGAITTNGEKKKGEPITLQSRTGEHCQSISVGIGEVNAEEQSSPLSRDGSVYEDLGSDCMVSEEGNGVPLFD